MNGFFLRGLKVALDALTGVAAAPTGTLRLAFMATTYTPNLGTQNWWSDISANIAAGTSTVALTGTANNIDTGNARVELDTNDVSVATVTTTTNRYVIFMDTGTPSTSPLIFTNAFVEGTLAPVSGTLGITVNVEGHAALNDN